MSAQSRLQLTALWQILVFLLNSLLFVLVGLQLPSVIDALEEESALELVGYALVVALTVMAVRFLWVFPFTHGPRWLSRRIRERDPSPSWRSVTIVAFTGMRGAVSLAAALAIPETIEGGAGFPSRDLILFLVYTTILWTVVVEGLSLPYLIRALGVRDEGEDAVEEDRARLAAARLPAPAVRESEPDIDGRSCRCAARGSSAMRRCGASSATSTWRRRGSTRRGRAESRHKPDAPGVVVVKQALGPAGRAPARARPCSRAPASGAPPARGWDRAPDA